MRTVDSYFDQLEVNEELILRTKLQISSSVHALISRPRLLQRLNQGLEGRLTLLCAAAGSGKTTLFADWLRSSHGQELPVAWVSLDDEDNKPARFWHYVGTALERIYPGIQEHFPLLPETYSHVSETMLIRLINDLTTSTIPFALVLDDYERITNDQIHHALFFLLKRMPPHMHLVLLTRFEPPLPLARLRVQGQVTEIREANLKFTPPEVEQFFTEAMRLPVASSHAQSLAERTEGWAAGLQLAALAMHDRSDLDQFLSSFTGSSRYIVDYLLEEVIGRQSAEVQSFLLSTAILGRMCASLCASVLDTHLKQQAQSQQNLLQALNSSGYCQEILEHLERTNLFLIPLDQERHWYRYHHLFAEALLSRLSLLHPTLVAELHVRASIWYEQQGLLSEAIEHALAAKDFLRATDLIGQAAAFHEEAESAMTREQQAFPLLPISHHTRTPTFVPHTGGLFDGVHSEKQPLLDPLSERELEALHLMAGGATNVAIAQQLIIAPATVKRHMSNIFSKLGVTNRTQAAAQARELGIL